MTRQPDPAPAVFRPRTLLAVAATFALVLIALSFAQDVAAYGLGVIEPTQRLWLVDLDGEQTICSWLASILLFCCAAQLFLVARDESLARGRLALAWLFLALVFLALSVDEAASIHEKIMDMIRAAYDMRGVFYFAWIIPAGIVCVIGLIAYAPLVRGLPSPERGLAMASAALFLGGVFGMEMVGGAYYDALGPERFGYRIIITIEESLELGGALLFLFVLDRLRSRQPAMRRRAAATAHPWPATAR